MMTIRHGIVELNNHAFNKKSGIIINNEVVLAPATLLENVPNLNIDWLKQLKSDRLIQVQNDSNDSNWLRTLEFSVIFDSNKLRLLKKSQSQPANFLTRQANLLYVYNSDNIEHFFSNLLAASINISSVSEVLLSSVLVLSIRNTKMLPFENLLLHFGNYVKMERPIKSLDDVLVICTPFGLPDFYKTISISKISNVIGKQDCLYVLSHSLPLGCEGSAVFNSELRLIGMVISTYFLQEKNNIQITLVANLSLLLKGFMNLFGLQFSALMFVPKQPKFPWERRLVLIEDNGRQGTGTLVKIQNRKLILTSAHVVSEADSTVICRTFNRVFNTTTLWRNPERNRAYDVALLTIPPHVKIDEKDFTRLSLCKPIVGQTVYSAGFPVFASNSIETSLKPLIFQGRIIKYSSGCLVSDASVQSGQSGGPMFDQHGAVLGVCVSNIKMDDHVFPNINKAVPISEIRHTLELYAKKDNLSILDNLIANEDIQNVWSMKSPLVLSRL